ncbi:MAG TPA: glycosyltransferase [Gaiellaceae bacterium]|jgi:GT2 family glycosyltransferase|nr:glycosyltransferase [Gaiellaceae bacterium]
MADPTPPGITVAIATLDRPELLARCLDAVLAGVTAPWEIVVVDQGRDPLTAAVVAEREEQASLVYVRQPTRGLAASRNAALAAATAPVLATTDDDCVPDREWLAAIGKAFAEQPAPQLVTGRVLPLGPERAGYHAISTRSSPDRVDLLAGVAPWRAGTGANTAVERERAERIGGWDERLGVGSAGGAGEDVDFLYRLMRAGARVRYEPEALVHHERQDAARRRATRTSYGRGIGACCGIQLRRGDSGGLRMLGQWTALRGGMLRRAVTQRDRRSAFEELLVARGTAGGLIYGLRVAG